MINHFWNLCRACPSVNIDKLSSEYRSTYRWHEYKPQPQHDIVTKPPAKKGGVGSGMQDAPDGETRVRISQPPPQATKTQLNGAAGGAAGGGSSDLPAAGQQSQQQHHHQQQEPRTPRKSKSMGRISGGGGGVTAAPAATEVGGDGAAGGTHDEALHDHHYHHHHRPASPPQPPAVTAAHHWHRGHRRTPSDGVAWRHSKGMEADRIIGGDNMLASSDEKVCKRAYKSEYRKKFRPFSQYQYVDGKFHKVKGDEPAAAGGDSTNNWYKEVIELRKQAGQYRARHDIGDVWRTVQHRGWGVETASERLAEIYTKQAELWEQVSRRSSLQALSLASATPSRPISKAEKEIENSRRSSPIKHVSTSSRERPSTAPPKPKPASVHAQKATDKTDGKKATDKTDGKTSKESTPRHHYERTTGSTGGRSVSVGPENRSPKRSSRPPSTHTTAPTNKTERRPRPTSLSTSARRKGTDALPHRPSSHDDGSLPKKASKAKPHDPTASPRKGEDKSKAEKKSISEETDSKKDIKDVAKDGAKDILKEGAKDSSKEPVEAVKESTARKSTPEPRFDPEKYEPVVKTPPEPTRVKSPDQMMVKSPDPVNWTVPLDTGKTFTVTHNIPEGESARGTPSSEPRHMLESRTRQTPEPTKISQGSLAGTPASAITSEAKSHTQEPTKPSTATPVEPKATDKKQEAKPTDSKPSTIKEADTKSQDSKVSKVEPKPADDKKDEKASDSKPSESKPFDSKPTDSKSEEAKVTDTKKPETEKLESKMAETKPVESSKSEPNPDPKKLESQPLGPQLLTSQGQHPAPKQASPVDVVPPTSGAVDPMTMSMFGSLNGMNGKSSGTPSPTKPEVPLPSEPSKDSSSTGVRNVPGTNLRCLDDPSFMFDKPSAGSTNPAKAGSAKVLEAPTDPQPAKGGSPRVLEAPEAPADIKDLPDSPSKTEPPVKPSPYTVLEATPKPKGSPYRVLEAPDAPYYPQTQTVGEPSESEESKLPSLVSPTSGRAVTEAMDKARARFDSFWGGPKDKDPPSKV